MAMHSWLKITLNSLLLNRVCERKVIKRKTNWFEIAHIMKQKLVQNKNLENTLCIWNTIYFWFEGRISLESSYADT